MGGFQGESVSRESAFCESAFCESAFCESAFCESAFCEAALSWVEHDQPKSWNQLLDLPFDRQMCKTLRMFLRQ